MKRQLFLGMFLFLSYFSGFGQFGPPPGGGGDGNGRSKSNASSTELNLESSREKGNSKVFGIVMDPTLKTPVEYATVSLIDSKSKKVLDGTMVDQNGKFSILKLAAGEYNFKFTFIGYEDRIVENIKIIKGEDKDLGVIDLKLNTNMLAEIEVKGVKSLIEERVDRLVYNAENDLTSKGGDGADVLRKVPLLTVDFDGNVSIRGSSNIKVLINNKPSTIVASSVADALKMIPADLIQTVEVITSPSAKYDAEGSSGIINIITKKSTIQGYNLSLDTGVGLRGSNLGLNGNLKVGKFGFSLGGFGRSFYNKASTLLDQTTFGNNFNTITNQTSDAKDLGIFGRYNLGINYDISKNQSLNANIAFGTRNFVRDQDFLIKQYSETAQISESSRQIKSKDLSNNIDVNLDYIKIFKPSQEWSISTQFSQNNLTNNFTSDNYSVANELINQQKNINGNVNREITVQSDYITPINKNQMFEIGVKRIMREVNSDYRYEIGKNSIFALDTKNPSGNLNYNQNISAGYLSYTFSTKNKINFKTGVRYEHTSIDALDNNNALLLPSYGNIVPSINISKSIKTTTLKLAYTNRIQRPGLQQLNPNFNASNPYNITIGNPQLKPEISNNIEFSVSKSINRNYFNASFFARQTNNSILQISTPSDSLNGAIITSYQNIGVQKAAGINLFGNLFFSQKWTMSGGVDLFYNYLSGQIVTLDGFTNASNSGITFNGRLNSNLSLSKGWGIQAFGGFRGNSIMLQGNRSGTPMYSLGVKKDFNNKKASLGLAVENIFGGMQFQTTAVSPLFSQKYTNFIYNQNVKLTFSYKIGNMKFIEDKKTKSVKNSDVKGEV